MRIITKQHHKRFTRITAYYQDGSIIAHNISPAKTALLFAVWKGHRTLGEIARFYKAAGFGYQPTRWCKETYRAIPMKPCEIKHIGGRYTMAENTALQRLCGIVYRTRVETRTRHDGSTYPYTVYYRAKGPAYLTRTKRRGPNGNLMWHYSLTPLGLSYCKAARAISTTGNPANYEAIMDILGTYDWEVEKQTRYIATMPTNTPEERALAARAEAVAIDAGGVLYDMASHGW